MKIFVGLGVSGMRDRNLGFLWGNYDLALFLAIKVLALDGDLLSVLFVGLLGHVNNIIVLSNIIQIKQISLRTIPIHLNANISVFENNQELSQIGFLKTCQIIDLSIYLYTDIAISLITKPMQRETEDIHITPQKSFSKEYLRSGDWITLSFLCYCLSGTGSNLSQLALKAFTKENPISGIFTIKAKEKSLSLIDSSCQNFILYGQPICIQHLISGKYLHYRSKSNDEIITLASDSTQKSLFIFKPIFQFQAQMENKIRAGELIAIQSLQEMNLYVELGLRNEIEAECLINLSKHEQSEFILSKVNVSTKKEDKSSFYIYALKNAEEESKICCARDSLNNHHISFSQSINQFGSYLLFEKISNNVIRKQFIIGYNQAYSIRFFSNMLYLGFNHQEVACLLEQSQQNCLFVLEKYATTQLGDQQFFKLKHNKSGKYLSVDKDGISLGQFRPFNIFYLKHIDNSEVLATTSINHIFQTISQLLQDKHLHKYRHQLKAQLRELRKILFLPSFNFQNYFTMNENLTLMIVSIQQQLLYQMGFLELLFTLVKRLMHSLDKNPSETSSIYHQLVAEIMLIIVGICYKNILASKAIAIQIPFILAAIFKLPGLIETIFYICQDYALVQTIQSTLLSLNGQTSNIVFHLIQNIRGLRAIQNNVKIKVLTLLQRLIWSTSQAKYLSHEYQLIEAIKNQDLDNILYRTQLRGDELFFQLDDEYVEFEEILQKRSKYVQHLPLMKKQLQFYCCLFRKTSAENIAYFRRMVPEEVVLNYIKLRLNEQDKRIFLKILDEIYLNSFPTIKSKIVFINGQNKIHFRQAQMQVMSSIQQQMLQTLRHLLKNELFNESLFLYIRIFCHFHELSLIQLNLWQELSLLLEPYLYNNFDSLTKLEEFENLAKEVFRFYSYSEEIHIQHLLSSIISVLVDAIRRKKQELSEAFLAQTLQQSFISQHDTLPKYRFLEKVIEKSVYDQSPMIISAFSLVHQLRNSSLRVIQRLKDTIYIEDDQTVQIVKQLHELHQQLRENIPQYIKLQNQNKDGGIIFRILKDLHYINNIFVQKNHKQKEFISPLIQNITRQLLLFPTFIELLESNLQKSNVKDGSLLKEIVNFMICFTYNNPTNLRICLNGYNSFKKMFKNDEQGQAKLLYLFAMNNEVVSAYRGQFGQLAISAIEDTAKPSYYSVLTLIKLILSDDKSQKSSANRLQSHILKNPAFVSQMLKRRLDKFMFQQQNSQAEDYCDYFHYYLFLVFRLMIVLAENGNRQGRYAEIVKGQLQLHQFLNLMLSRDLFQGNAFMDYGSLLMKEQLIKFFSLFYENQISQLKLSQLYFLKDFSFNFINRLINYNYEHEPQQTSMIEDQLSIYSMYSESIKVKYNYEVPSHMTIICLHYTIVCVFYPFVLNISTQLQEMKVFRANDEEFNQMHLKCIGNIVSLFSANEQAKSLYQSLRSKYNEALLYIEETLKTKLNIDRSQNLQLGCKDNVIFVGNSTPIYRTDRLHNLIDNLRFTKKSLSPITEAIYRAILVMVYSPLIKNILQSTSKKIKIANQSLLFQSLITAISALAVKKQIALQQAANVIDILINHQPQVFAKLLNTISDQYRQMNCFLFSQNQQISAQSLCSYLKVLNQFMDQIISSQDLFQSHSITDLFLQNKDRYKRNPLSITLKISCKMLWKERQLYDRKDLQKLLESQQQINGKLNYQTAINRAEVKEILRFTINYLILTKNNEEKMRLLPIVLEVLNLIKSYIKFINFFSRRYVPLQLFDNLKMCLKIVKSFISDNNQYGIKLLLDALFYEEFNCILTLDDTFQSCKAALAMPQHEQFQRMIYEIQNHEEISRISAICKASVSFYGEQIAYQWGRFPLQNTPSLHGSLKRCVVTILKELQVNDSHHSRQILLNIKEETLKQNISIVYCKYFELYSSYDVKSLYPKEMGKKNKLAGIAEGLFFENGIDLTSLLMYLGLLREDSSLSDNFNRYCKDNNKGRSSSTAKNNVRTGQNFDLQMQKRYQFFYSKMGRVEVIAEERLISIDFFIPPECIITTAFRKKCFQKINFLSTQSKLESFQTKCSQSSYLFGYYQAYIKSGVSAKLLVFIDKYLYLLKMFNLLFIYAATVVLLTSDSTSDHEQTTDMLIFNSIIWINVGIAIIYFAAYIVQAAPLIVGKMVYKLEQKGVFFKSLPGVKRSGYIALQFVNNAQFLYNLTFLILMLCILVYKPVIALMAVDLLVQIPQMDILVKTIWRGKYEIAFTIMSFLLFGYYYSIFIYLVLVIDPISQFQAYCQNPGSCFYYVLVVHYRMIGGFPGLLFSLNRQKTTKVTLQWQDILDDVYLILIFLVFEGIFFTILLHQYSKIQKEIADRKDTLAVSCLICGLSRTIFNQSATSSFKAHVSSQHSFFDYLYYYYFLNKKTIYDRCRYENDIIITPTTSWFPVHCAKGFRDPQTNQ